MTGCAVKWHMSHCFSILFTRPGGARSPIGSAPGQGNGRGRATGGAGTPTARGVRRARAQVAPCPRTGSSAEPRRSPVARRHRHGQPAVHRSSRSSRHPAASVRPSSHEVAAAPVTGSSPGSIVRRVSTRSSSGRRTARSRPVPGRAVGRWVHAVAGLVPEQPVVRCRTLRVSPAPGRSAPGPPRSGRWSAPVPGCRAYGRQEGARTGTGSAEGRSGGGRRRLVRIPDEGEGPDHVCGRGLPGDAGRGLPGGASRPSRGCRSSR
ncbi:hypothetical protein SAMN05428939_1016 [Streptomyces sp. TLI_105]|nr:hypothetical protein SAMN05428939_1016 [Streptomyces sp. TLI_105]